MGNYCYINAHFPVAELSSEEQTFLAELRQRLPSGDEWRRLSWDEQRSRQEAVHQQLGIPGDSGDWKFVEQWQRDSNWYVTHELKPHLSPPFPRVLTAYCPPWSKNYVPAVWRTVFSSPCRWSSKWSIFQTLTETRQYTPQVFRQLLSFLHQNPWDIEALRKDAPPGSLRHMRLRGVLSLFELRHFVALHRQVIALDLPMGTILELNLLDAVCDGPTLAAYIANAEVFTPVLNALEPLNFAVLENARTLDNQTRSDEE